MSTATSEGNKQSITSIGKSPVTPGAQMRPKWVQSKSSMSLLLNQLIQRKCRKIAHHQYHHATSSRNTILSNELYGNTELILVNNVCC